MWTRAAYEANKALVLHIQLRYGLQSITTSVSLLCPMSIAWARELVSYQSNLCHSWGYELFYLSFATGRIACDHYARECEFGILKKKNKTKQKKQEKSFSCVFTKWGVPLNSSVVWELTTKGQIPFHCGIVRLQKFTDSLKACFEKYCCSMKKKQIKSNFYVPKVHGLGGSI